MKAKHLFLLISLALASVLLSACSGATAPASWAGVTVDGETLYVSYNTQVFAINATNGQLIWRYPEKGNANQTFYAAPALTDDKRLVVGGYNKSIFLLDPKNLTAPVWTFSEAINTYVAAPLIQDGQIYAPNTDGTLYVLDEKGLVSWEFPTEHALWGSPVRQDDVLYLAGQDHHVYAVNAQTGETIWETVDLGGAVVGSPVLGDDGRLYVGTLGSEIVILDANSGEVLKEFKADGWIWGSPLVSQGVVYFGDLKGNLYAIDAVNMDVLWRFKPETTSAIGISGTPLLFNDTLYVGSENGNVYAINPQTGRQECQLFVGGKLLGGPLAAGDKVIVTPVGFDAPVVAVGPDCTLRWSFIPPK